MYDYLPITRVDEAIYQVAFEDSPFSMGMGGVLVFGETVCIIARGYGMCLSCVERSRFHLIKLAFLHVRLSIRDIDMETHVLPMALTQIDCIFSNYRFRAR